MLKFLSVKCFLNLLQLHLAMPFPFLLKYTHTDIAILPLSIAGSRYDAAFPTIPLHSHFTRYSALNVCMPVVFPVKSI